ncbi:hypothetical protein FJT64_015358 [Amphibalanus amphitrite]|uniref:Uncharacterized protein n=1 Tax=Amphibalanus amphitrite TaxID=1232801 RepID=A0A6A4XFT2_AMPAM|nr:hypothetical protein FJT64_015358 [Amphibalanus amphitrite]
MNSTGLSIPAVESFRQGDDFGRWLRGVERYLCAVGIQEADRKCAVLLHLVGPDVADLSETLPEETSETADSFERLKGKLMAYLSPVRNAVAERSLFHGMQMEPEEDLERFLGRLRAQVVRCGYAATEVDRELRDRCVLGSRADLRAKLVKLAASRGDGLTLAEVRQTARAHREMEQLGAQLGGTRLAEAPAADAEGAVNAPARTLEGGLERHSAVFNEELGRIPIKEGLQLKSDAKPMYRRARPVPLALRDAGGGIGRRDTGGSKERRDDSGRRDAGSAIESSAA